MFPDPHSRPARHTFPAPDLPPGMLVQCEVIAFIKGELNDHRHSRPRLRGAGAVPVESEPDVGARGSWLRAQEIRRRLGARSSRHQAQSARDGHRRNRRAVSFAAALPAHARRKAGQDHGGVGGRESRLHRPASEGVPQPFSGRLRDPAGTRRAHHSRFPGNRPLRKRSRIHRPADRHRPGRRRQQHAHARRRILVSAVGKDGAVGSPRAHSFHRLQARTRKL